LAKISRKFFSLFTIKAYEKFFFRVSFRENFCFRKRFRENFPFGMRIRIQEPLDPDPNTGGCYLTFLRKPSREQKSFAKTFAKTKIFTKSLRKLSRKRKFSRKEILRYFAKSERIFAFRDNEKRGFRFNPSDITQSWFLTLFHTHDIMNYKVAKLPVNILVWYQLYFFRLA
jgi:hypothetical protein